MIITEDSKIVVKVKPRLGFFRKLYKLLKLKILSWIG